MVLTVSDGFRLFLTCTGINKRQASLDPRNEVLAEALYFFGFLVNVSGERLQAVHKLFGLVPEHTVPVVHVVFVEVADGLERVGDVLP